MKTIKLTFSHHGLLLALLAGSSPLLFSQTTAGIVGTVSDPTAAVIPDVQIEVQNTETGIVRRTTTNERGYYTISILQPGSYAVALQKEGFRALTRTGIVLETGGTITLDVTLEVGAVTEQITVDAAVPLLESETSTVGQLIESTMVANMPIESRRSASLVRLSGAVTYRSEGGAEAVPTFSIAGGRSNNQYWQLDGTSLQNSAIGIAILAVNPPAESLREFKVELNSTSAEYGRSGGGFIFMTTKAGTNAYHGALYEFLRNDTLDARTFFAPGKAPLRLNIFGGSIGGPIKKDKTFFFFNYEGTRRRDGRTFANDDVPHAPEVGGDFSNRVDTTILDPLTGDPFPNNIIPSSRIDPLGQRIARLYPAPNRAGNDITRAPRDNFRANVSDPLTQNRYTARVDHNFSSSDRLFGRYSRYPSHSIRQERFPDRFADPWAGTSDADMKSIAFSWFHSFSPTLMNDFRYTWRNRGPVIHRGGNFMSGKNGEFGIQGVDPDFFATVRPRGLTDIGTNNHERDVQVVQTIEAVDNMNWVKGNHQLKAGFSFRHSEFVDEQNRLAGGLFEFSDRPTGSGLASLLLGWTTAATLIDNIPQFPRTDYVSAYVQDDWKVTPRLTVNLGLRWDMDTPRWELDNKQSGFDINATNPVSGTPGIVTFAGLDGRSKYTHNFDKNNIGPRFGFAYRVREDLVVRGGYGFFFYPPYLSQVATRLAGGFSKASSFRSPDGGFTPVFPFSDGMPPPPPGEALDASFGAVPLGERPRFSPEFLQDDHRTGYSQQWNFTIQKQLPANSMLELAYLGNVGHKMPSNIRNLNVIPLVNGRGPEKQDQLLRPFPQFSNVNLLYPNRGNSAYHALNVKFEKRYSQGLNFLMNYTYSKFLDDVEASGELAGAERSGFQHPELWHLDRALAGNDIRHRYILSGVYELPVGKGRSVEISNPVLNQLVGGWGLGAITEFRSGAPWGAVELTNRTNTFSHSQRPNLLSDPRLPSGRPRSEFLARWFDTSALEAPGVGVFGTAPRTICCGPGFVQIDVNLHKWFDLTERYRLQFRADFFNIINRPNFRNPAARRGRGDFGRIGGILTGATGRQIQFSLRFEF